MQSQTQRVMSQSIAVVSVTCDQTRRKQTGEKANQQPTMYKFPVEGLVDVSTTLYFLLFITTVSL